MKIVILGAGRRGIRLARNLTEEKKEVVIIDESIEAVNKAMSSVDCLAFQGSGTDTDDLANAGCGDADVFVALTSSDETNLVSCGIVSSTFKVKTTIAVVRNISYTKADGLLGVSYIMNPYQEAAERIYQDIEKGIYADSITFENSQLSLYNIYIETTSFLPGTLVKDLRKTLPGQYNIAAISSSSSVMVPNGDTVIKAGDTLSVVANEDTAKQLLAQISGIKKHRTRKITIVGSTKVTDFLLHMCSPAKRKNIVVIAKDPQPCEEYAEKYPECLVINDNITHEGLFESESLDKSDLFMCLTDNDELNMIYASYAKHHGVRNIISLVRNNPDYINIADHLGIDSLISTQDVTVDSVMQYIHSSHLSGIHSLFGGKIQVFEYKCTETCPVVEKKLCNINMKGFGLIAGVSKADGSTVIPSGSYTISCNDTLMVVMERTKANFIYEILGIRTEE